MELSLQLQQKQVLSLKQQQSVAILQMNALALSEYAREMAEENPLLEWSEEGEPFQPRKEKLLQKMEWLEEADGANRGLYQMEHEADDERTESLKDGKGQTLREHLLFQINTRNIPEPNFAYSEMAAIGALIKALPTPAALHLGNSSSVRYAQLYALPEEVEVCCNRGVNGIEGTLSTAIGYSVCSDKLNFVVLGDLSFFYDMNALWNNNFGCNLRILMLNNGGGEIFQTLQGLELGSKAHRFITASHQTTAKSWAEERKFTYFAVHNTEELSAAMEVFTQPTPHNQPMFMEVFTDATEDIRLLKEYYHQLKNKS